MRKTYLLLLFVCLLTTLPGLAQLYTWKGSWITNTLDTTARGAPYFRKIFTVSRPVKKATAYICGVGYHISYLNGNALTTAVLEQGYTRYDKRLLYTSYDVSALLQRKNNCLGVELGNGWYNIQSASIWFFDRVGWRKTPRLLLNLVLEYKDGSSETIATDSSWACTTGPGVYNGMHTGEVYDARKELPGWNTAGYPATGWQPALVTQSPGGVLQPQQMPSVQVIRRIQPVAVTVLGKGRWLYDMGQNFAGVATLRVQGRAGDSVVMHYGEVLNKDGSLNRTHNASQLLMKPGDMPFQTDIYTLKGGGKETFTPRFTYHGFQYVEVQASGEVQLDIHALEGLFYSTGFAPAGSFSSSDTMLNKLYAAALQSYRSNFISIPTDCPQREKNGWTADAHVAAELGLWNFDAADGYRKWLDDVKDVQLADGSLPGIAPTLGRGYHWTSKEDDGFGPAWGSALPLITWYLYLYDADTATVRKNYPAVKLYTDRLVRRAKGYIYSEGFGDWMALQETPVPFVSTAYFHTDAKLLSKMAGILGNAADERKYGLLADSIRTAFNQRFLQADSALYGDSSLTALSGALFHELCPDAYRQQVAARLAAGVVKRNYHADFGVLGTKYILPVLSNAGYADIALRLLTDTGYAGWGHWIANGATTLYEDWPGIESHNHVFFGDYAAWFFKSLAGIQPDEKAPGFRHFFLHPVFPQQLSHIAVTHQTHFGQIAVSWKREGQSIIMQAEVPAGATASVTLPGYERELAAGKHTWTIKETH